MGIISIAYKKIIPLLLFCVLTGCAMNKYTIGYRSGHIPQSDTNINLILAGYRGGAGGDELSRTAVWCPVFSYDSFRDITFFHAPLVVPLFGKTTSKNENGYITPLFSYHSGDINEFCVGPFFFPIYESTVEKDGEQHAVLGRIFTFGSKGFSFLFLGERLKTPIFSESYIKEYKFE